MQFFMLVQEKAKSYNSKNNRGYQQRLATEAQNQVNTQELEWVSSPDTMLYSQVLYFHRRASETDADNISKPILDALRGTVFDDDKQVVSRTAKRIDISKGYTLLSENISEEWYMNLLTALNNVNINDIIFIEIGELLEMKVSFGEG